MSEPQPSNGTSSFFDAVISAAETATRRGAEGDRVAAVQSEAWRSHVVAPIATFSEAWVSGWARLSETLRCNDLTAASCALVGIDGMLGELKSLRAVAEQALDEWYREEATQYHVQYPGGGTFHRTWYSQESESAWLRKWWVSRPDPHFVPSALGSWVESRVPKHWLEYDEYQVPLRTVAFFAMLGTEKTANQYEACLGQFGPLGALAGICPVLRAVILPTPGVIELFFSGDPSNEEIVLAHHVLYWSTGVIGDNLRDEFRKYLSHRQTQATPPAEVILIPAEPEVVPPSETPSFPNVSPDPISGPLSDGVYSPNCLVYNGQSTEVAGSAVPLLKHMLEKPPRLRGIGYLEAELLRDLYDNSASNLKNHVFKANDALAKVAHPERLIIRETNLTDRYVLWVPESEKRKTRKKPEKNE